MLASRSRQPQSGSLSTAVLVVPLAILIAVPLLSFVYAYAEIFIPIAGWITVFLLGGFAYGLAWTVDQASLFAKCRSVVFVRVMGAVAGSFGLYCSWVAFTFLLLQRSHSETNLTLLQIFENPAGVFEFASELAKTGWYTIGGITPSGALIWILWAVEAAVLIGVPLLITGKFIGDTVYCEGCGKWCDREAGLILTGLPETQEDRELVEAGDPAALQRLPAKPQDLHAPRVQIELQSCPRCRETGALRARILEHRKDDKGKITVKMTELIPLVLMTSDERDALRRARTPQRR